MRFVTELVDPRFPYGKPVADYLDELWVDAIDLETHQKVFADLPVGEERTKRVQAAGEIKKKFLKHLGQLDEVVAPYLDMGGIRREKCGITNLSNPF
jgi:hypothetical protein